VYFDHEAHFNSHHPCNAPFGSGREDFTSHNLCGIIFMPCRLSHSNQSYVCNIVRFEEGKGMMLTFFLGNLDMQGVLALTFEDRQFWKALRSGEEVNSFSSYAVLVA